MATDWIQTFTGRKFFPLDPDPAEIVIEDIAHSLSMQCRYNGHTKEFYSVAQHSVLLSRKYWPRESGCRVEMSIYALLHDAAEAYLSDIPRPLKYLPEFKFYLEAEGHLERAIFARFGLHPTLPALIKETDNLILSEEAERFMAPLHPDWRPRNGSGLLETVESWSPALAELEFLDTFNELMKERSRK